MGRRKPIQVLGKMEPGGSSGNGKPEKTTTSKSTVDDSNDGNDGEKLKEEERKSFRVAAAAREAVLQKQVTSIKQELEMEKEYSASSLSSGSNASKCVVALKLTDAHKNMMKSFQGHAWMEQD